MSPSQAARFHENHGDERNAKKREIYQQKIKERAPKETPRSAGAERTAKFRFNKLLDETIVKGDKGKAMRVAQWALDKAKTDTDVAQVLFSDYLQKMEKNY